MLSHDLKDLSIAEFQALPKSKLIAVYSFRFDAHLVPAMKENLWPIVDGFVGWDDRESEGIFTSEGARREALIEEARRLGANWIIGIDPDERFEQRARLAIRACMRKRPAIWSFKLRELYETDKYRSDGVWGKKRVLRLFPVSSDMVFEYDAIHSSFSPIYPVYKVRHSHINLYHLKMIQPARRSARRNLYNLLDPERRYQTLGYDYLSDEDGLELTEIPHTREYHPPHIEDGGLWMAMLDEPGSDTAYQVSQQSQDSADTQTEDHDLRKASVVLVTADALAHSGKLAERASLLESFDHTLNDTDRIDALRLKPPLGSTTTETCFRDKGWTAGDVSITWGSKADAFRPMSAVAIGVGAPAELKDAVSSLLSQETAINVIVVNSGGGDLQELLGELAPRVIAVSVPERVYIGAARNIGLSISNSTWISFLAGDCIARPDWAKNRLSRHMAGCNAVASALVNSDPQNAIAWAYHLFIYVRRLPDTREADRTNYGLSLPREMIVNEGCFDPKMRIGEDTALNRRIASKTTISFATDVVTEHRAETRLAHALAETIARARRTVRLKPIMEDRSLAPKFGVPWFALRQEIRRAYIGKFSNVYRVRRGLNIPHNWIAYRLGLGLLPLFIIAHIIGIVVEFSRELADRRRAQKILMALQVGDKDKALETFARIPSTCLMGQFPARELAAELARADMHSAAYAILDRVMVVGAQKSDVERLRRAIKKGKLLSNGASRTIAAEDSL